MIVEKIGAHSQWTPIERYWAALMNLPFLPSAGWALS